MFKSYDLESEDPGGIWGELPPGLEGLYAKMSLKGGIPAGGMGVQQGGGGLWSGSPWGPQGAGSMALRELAKMNTLQGPTSEPPWGPVLNPGRGATFKPLDSMLASYSPLKEGSNDFRESTMGNVFNFLSSGPWLRQPNQQTPQNIWDPLRRSEWANGYPETGWNARTGTTALMR